MCWKLYCLIAEKIYVPKETKYINVTRFNLITNKDEVLIDDLI